ncbi:glutathione hydrolase 3-like [Aristolochia californica]|uniref:glutathione hydrolase 3-like n=1 Tax=Aristolochia californica TaxID=171875 RepID=UPI0035E129C5
MAQVNLKDPLLGSHRTDRKIGFKVLIAALTAFTVLAAALALCYGYYNDGFDSEGRDGLPSWEKIKRKDRNVAESEVGVVAADDSRCSSIGVSVLKEGGHAVDAAVATALCLGVVNSMSSGIGGGGFMVLRDGQTGRSQAFNFRETAPSAATLDIYERNPQAKRKGPLSLGVPGEIAGLHVAWLQQGRIPWRSLFQPSIKLARDGFVVAPCLAGVLKTSQKAVMADPGLRRVFAPDGKPLVAGDVCYNPKLADTLEMVAEQGPGAFYNGTVGEQLVSDVRAAGGIITMDDLRQYKVEVTEAMRVDAMGYTILGMPPPSAGTVGLSLVLKILESYGSVDAVKGPLGLHRLIESLKHMLAVRMDLGDPNFVNVTHTVSKMLSSSFAQQIHQAIVDNTTFASGYYRAKWSQLRDHGTSHFSIVDANRNALSMTTTVNYYFGAEMLSPSTGILLNNEMDDFSIPAAKTIDGLPPPPSNFIQPNKRPLSSMTPIIILKGDQLAGVLGGSGGLFITPAVIQVFLNHFVLGMEPLDAVLRPRVYHMLTPNLVFYENITAIDGDHIELQQESELFLKQRGHILSPLPRGASCQLVVHDLRNAAKKTNQANQGLLTAVSDPRKNGRPAAI